MSDVVQNDQNVSPLIECCTHHGLVVGFFGEGRYLECASLTFSPIWEKGNWTSGVFCENSTNSEVNSKQMMLLEYVAYVTFSELIIFSVEDMLQK